MNILKKIFYILLLTYAFCCGSTFVTAQTLSRHQAISAYIYNFAKNIRWQNENAIEEFNFLFIGDDKEVFSELKKLSQTKKLHNKPIVIKTATSLESVDKIHVVFLEKSKEGQLVEIFDKIDGKNILLITDNYQDKRLIMINFVEQANNTLGFEINKANLINQHLTILDDIVLLGGTSVDIAALYKEGQQSLRSMQKYSEHLESNLKWLEKQLETAKIETQIQKDSIKKQSEKIIDQQKILDLEIQEFEKKGKELITLKEEIKKGNEILQKQTEEIENQKKEIFAQSKILKEQGATIHYQQNLVYLLVVIVVLTVLLIINIYKGYRRKHNLNNELEVKVAERTEEIQKLNAELEKRVELRTAQLEASNKELEAFSYSVSHDLRAPLRHASGYVDLLVKKFKSDLPEKAQHYLFSISDSVHQMGVLIDDLLQFSRTGRAEMRQVVTDLNPVLQEIITLLQKDNPNRDIEWEICKLPSVYCDEAMLKLVWMNLLSNAVKYTRKTEKAKIKIDVQENELEHVFSVSDNGVGFDMQYANKLFGVFQRLHSMAEFEGTGIGLANVRRIISRHNGRTWAEAELDKGAKFYFTLPKTVNSYYESMKKACYYSP